MSHPSRVRELKQSIVGGYIELVRSHPSRVRELKPTDEDKDPDATVAPLPGA